MFHPPRDRIYISTVFIRRGYLRCETFFPPVFREAFRVRLRMPLKSHDSIMACLRWGFSFFLMLLLVVIVGPLCVCGRLEIITFASSTRLSRNAVDRELRIPKINIQVNTCHQMKCSRSNFSRQTDPVELVDDAFAVAFSFRIWRRLMRF